MKKSMVVTAVLLLAAGLHLKAQDTLSNGKALNVPFREYGISLGNSKVFNGIRINFADRNVQKINGLNLTFWSKFKTVYNKDAVVNGISIGVVNNAKKMQPLNIFLLGAGGVGTLNGLSVAGIEVASEKIAGITLTGFMLGGKSVSGVSLSGLFTFTEKAVNGLSISGLAILSEGDINGLAASLAGIYAENTLRGLSVTAGYLKAGTSVGLMIAGYANTTQSNGVSIALVNRSKELHGLQVGLLNFAGNNRKGLRLLPLLNLHR